MGQAYLVGRGGAVKTGVEMVLLWENASPTSTFAAQNVAIANITDYDMLLIECSYASDGPYRYSCLFKAEVGAIGISHIMWASTGNYSHRQVEVIETGIAFGPGHRTGKEANGYTIPLRFYGLKGVTWK